MLEVMQALGMTSTNVVGLYEVTIPANVASWDAWSRIKKHQRLGWARRLLMPLPDEPLDFDAYMQLLYETLGFPPDYIDDTCEENDCDGVDEDGYDNDCICQTALTKNRSAHQSVVHQWLYSQYGLSHHQGRMLLWLSPRALSLVS